MPSPGLAVGAGQHYTPRVRPRAGGGTNLLSVETVKEFVHRDGLSRRERLALCLAAAEGPVSVAALREVALDVGLPAARKWNVSDILGRPPAVAIRTTAGWELSPAGRAVVARLAPVPAAPPAAATLRSCLARIADDDSRRFVEEAVSCVERGLHRAAVVLSWVGAVSLLHQRVASHALVAFNAEAMRRDPAWRKAKGAGDLGRMGEFDFLQVIAAISVIDKNVKQELEGCLKLRNSCGHPNRLKIGGAKVQAHLEVLALNVFSGP